MWVRELSGNQVFVFGSNLAGRHGRGAAAQARAWGARRSVPEGLAGSTYAIPTKDERIRTLPLSRIRGHVGRFLEFARSRPDLQFLVTRIGCGLAGYSDSDIAPMFAGSPDNVVLPDAFREVLKTGT